MERLDLLEQGLRHEVKMPKLCPVHFDDVWYDGPECPCCALLRENGLTAACKLFSIAVVVMEGVMGMRG